MTRRTPAVRIFGKKVSRRAVTIFGAVAMTLGGMVVTAALPAFLAIDSRLITPEECVSGLLVGLMIAFVGNGVSGTLTSSRKKVSSAMTPSLDSDDVTTVQEIILGYGYLSSASHRRDDVSLVFTYRPRHPYSVLMDIAMAHDYLSDPVVWEVSRETLRDAVILGRSNDTGDFRAAPLGSRRVRLRVMGTDVWGRDAGYHYDMHVSRAKLRSFLARTATAVPFGHEAGLLNLDAQLQKLLA